MFSNFLLKFQWKVISVWINWLRLVFSVLNLFVQNCFWKLRFLGFVFSLHWIFVCVEIGEIAPNMRGRSCSYSPSPSPPRRYSRRRHSLSPRGRYRGCDRDLPTSLLVRNLNRDCRYVCQWRIFALAVVFSVYLQWLFVLLLCGSGLWVFFLCCLLMFLLYVMEA